MSAPFVEAEWLLARSGNARIRIVDTRSTPHGAPGQTGPTGAEQYAAGHIPGAIFLDYAEHLHDPATPYAARVALPDRFARALGERGIGDGHSVIAYDAGTVPYAARFVWMCRYYGHDDVRILAGGFTAWQAAGGLTTTAMPHHAPARFSIAVRPRLRATRAEVLSVAEGRSDAQLLETQRDATYALRNQDIKGARRLSGSRLMEDSRGGRIADPAELADLIDELGLNRSKRTIVSCGSGVSASGSYLALLEAGFSDVAVYDGSWMEWEHDGLPTVAKKTV